jgi:hypothetical protein
VTIERMPMEWGLRSGAAVAAVVALFGGYLVADAYDRAADTFARAADRHVYGLLAQPLVIAGHGVLARRQLHLVGPGTRAAHD